MSFSRAKIHRFNDISSDVPSPTRYDPKAGDTGKAAGFGKCERERTVSQSSDTMSCGGTPFRTPYSVPKKHSCVASTEKPSVVVRSMSFMDGSAGAVPNVTVTDHEFALLKTQLTDVQAALTEARLLTQQLRQENESFIDQKLELESRIAALESAKADLECVISNNKNCETQVVELTEQLKELEKILEKNNIAEKLAREELTSQAEDDKIKYETRLVSLEGTLDQVKLEYQEKVVEVKRLQEISDKLKVSNECLCGKVASLETEVRQLECALSEKEQMIFALEERASALSSLLEAAQTETRNQHKILSELSEQLREQEHACRLHETTITGLDMQIGEKQKEVDKLAKESFEQVTALSCEVVSLKGVLEELKKTNEQELNELTLQLAVTKAEAETALQQRDSSILQLNDKIFKLEEVLASSTKEFDEKLRKKQNELYELKDERDRLLKTHEEEMFCMEKEWEKKMVSQVQEAEQSLLEKDAIMKLAELQHLKSMRQLRDEMEGHLRTAEEEANRRQSAQLEAGEMLKAKYDARVADLESNLAQVLECKARQLAEENERYEEVRAEVTAHLLLVEEKNKEISTLTCSNHKLTGRVSNMLEEIKLLNSENADKAKALEEMTKKFEIQLQKNDKLSERLGELDCKVATVCEQLSAKNADEEKLRSEYTTLKLQNSDLQLTLATTTNQVNSLTAELEGSRSDFKTQLVDLYTELTNVKAQCYKFEIALANTRNSLDELGKRLIESESEVETLLSENETIRNQLVAVENQKNDSENNYRQLMSMKNELELKLESTIKELELKNCDLELTKNDLHIMRDSLEEDKKGYESALADLQKLVAQKQLEMVQLERSCLEHIEAVSQGLVTKLDDFQKFSTELIQKLNAKIAEITLEKEELIAKYQVKCDDYETLYTDHDILKTTFEIATKESQEVKEQYEKRQEEIDDTKAKLQALVVEKKSLTEQVLELKNLNEEFKANLADKIHQMGQLENHINTQSSVISDLKSRLAEKSLDLDSLSSELSKVQAEFEVKVNDLQTTKDAEISQLIREQKECKAKLLASTDEVVSLLASLDDQSKKVAAFELSNRSMTQHVEILEKRIAELTESLEEAQQIQSATIKQLEVAKGELNEMKSTESSVAKAHKEQIVQLTSACEAEAAKQCTEWKSKWESMLQEKEAMAAELLAMTEKKDKYKFHCQEFERQAAEATQDSSSVMKDFEQLHSVLQEKDSEIMTLRKRLVELESLIGPFREQLELYETERMMLENDREQLKKQHLEQAAKLGHQNHKQKIQHVVKLKEDIFQLRTENQKLQCEIKSKNKIIENLREDAGEHPKRLFINGKRPTSTPFKGKENDDRLSPVMRVKQESGSPMALKNRNQ